MKSEQTVAKKEPKKSAKSVVAKAKSKNTFTFDQKKQYDVQEAIALVKQAKTTKFVASIDIAIKLNLDPKKSEQQLRGVVTLPHFFGKKPNILVLDQGLTQKDAAKYGVAYAGGSELINDINQGWLPFDLIITTPKMMPELAKLGKVLGAKGLMPNPKNGNITTNLKETIAKFQQGLTKYRNDSYGNIHLVVGKMDAKNEAIAENINFLLDFLRSKKPSTVKGAFIQKIHLSSTMGPSVQIALPKSETSAKTAKK